MSKFPEKSITISFSKGSSCEVDTLLEEASIIEDDSMSKAFSGQILSEINLLLVDKSLWEVFLQEILEAEESEKTIAMINEDTQSFLLGNFTKVATDNATKQKDKITPSYNSILTH